MITPALNTKVTKIGNKIPNFANLATKAALNTKAAEVESKITDITNVATKAGIQKPEIENKIPYTTGFITTPEFNRLTKMSFDSKMKKKNSNNNKESRKKTSNI